MVAERRTEQAKDEAELRVSGHTPKAVYQYPDESNRRVGAVARFAPGTLRPRKKSFVQYRDEQGRLLKGLNGIRLPLYRMPELIDGVRQGKTIFVAEGEACADVLVSLDLVATTNPGGAGHWHDSYSDHLRDADVVLLPDNDCSGATHMQEVARSCHGVARRLRVVELPGLPDKGDIVDWLRNGGTKDEFLELIEKAPEFHPRQAESTDGWQVPQPFGVSSEPRPFPLEEAMPPPIAEFAAAVADTVMVDHAASAVLVSAVLSTAAGNVYQVRVSRSYAEPNLARYSVWGAPSGERKSATFRHIVSPLESWAASKLPAYRSSLVDFASDSSFFEKLAQAAERKGSQAKSQKEKERWRAEARTARKRIPHRPRRPELFIGDVTSPALVRFIDEAGGGYGVLCPDARHVADAILGQHRQDGRIDDSVYLRAHAGDRIDRGRIGMQASYEVPQTRPSRICEQPL